MVEEVLAPSPEAQAEARDAAAFPKVVAAHHDDMARVAFVVVGLPKPSQDAAQAAWVKVWRERATITSPDRLRPWLMGNAAKEARHLAETGFETSQDADPIGLATQAASTRAYRTDELALATALGALDVHDRMILGLRWVAGLDADAIGIELSMPNTAVLARVVGILERWLKDPSFAAAPTETLEHYEREMAAQLRSLADRAVVEIDAAAVAQTAIETVPAPSLQEQLDELVQALLERARAVDRRIWMAVGGFAVVLIAGFALLGGRGSGGVALGTPVPTDATRFCLVDELELRITQWQAVGDERIAIVEARNLTGGACLLDGAPEPWLVDATELSILRGQDLSAPSVRIGPGEALHIRVHAENYCGRTPEAPVSVAFRTHDGLLAAKPFKRSDMSGVPPCTQNGPSRLWLESWTP